MHHDTPIGRWGLSALGVALYSLGIPEDTVLEYEQAVKADGYLVVAHGSPAEVEQARSVLAGASPARLDVHEAVETPTPHAGHAHA